MSRKLALNFRNLSDPDLYGMATLVVGKLTNNDNFPDAEPLLPPIRETAGQFLQAMSDASLGDMYHILIKNGLKEKLIGLLRALGEWVEKKSNDIDSPNGIEAVLCSSGFRMAKPRSEVELQNPTEFCVLPGKRNGQIILQVKRVKGAKAYMYQYTRDPLTDESKWETINSTQRKLVISNLPLGVKFLFRMAAIGPRNQIVYTEIMFRYIA